MVLAYDIFNAQRQRRHIKDWMEMVSYKIYINITIYIQKALLLRLIIILQSKIQLLLHT
jgi:hypothetical protein